MSSSDALLLPSVFSSIDFSNESGVCIRCPKYRSFSFSIFSPSIEYLGLISLKIDWSGLLAVQGTLRSLLQNHSSRTSILQRSIFFTVQLSQLYVTTGKTLVLTILIFDGIPVELFQILKDDAVKVLHSICQEIWKIQQCSQDRKRLVFFPVSRKELPKMFKLPHSCMHFIWSQINAQNSPSQASKVHELKSSRCSS